MLVTDKRIFFLDRNRKLLSLKADFRRLPKEYKVIDENPPRFPPRYEEIPPRYGMVTRWTDTIDFGLFWALDPSVNGELHEEFKKNPGAYSKVPGVWWSQGFREWIWISEPARFDDSHLPSALEFPGLELVRAIAMSGVPGRNVPTHSGAGSARLLLADPKELPELLECINSTFKPGFGSPFTAAYIASQPQNLASGAYQAYMYAFWAFCGVVILAFLLAALAGFGGVLVGIGLPLWIAIPVVVIAVVILARQLRVLWQKHIRKLFSVSHPSSDQSSSASTASPSGPAAVLGVAEASSHGVFCTNCGATLAARLDFCGACGAKRG
jgi:hypothetical protein